MSLEVNTIYEFTSSKVRFRLLEADPGTDEAITVRMDVRLARPKPHPLSRLRDQLTFRGIIPVYALSTPDSVTPQHQLEYRDKMMGVIQPIIDLGLHELATGDFWKHITNAAAKAKLSSNCVYGTITRYLQGGCCAAAITPRWSSRGRHRCDFGDHVEDYRPTNQPGSFTLTPKDIQNIQKGAKEFYKADASWERAHKSFLEKFYLSHIEIDTQGREVRRALPAGKCPGPWQFYRLGRRHLKTVGLIKAKKGVRGFKLTGRGKPGSQAARGIYPGYVAEIDWTLTDVVAVRRRNRASIGRLAVYAIVDRFSGMILSIYLTMSTGRWEEAARAILICMEDKTEVCAKANYHLKKPADWAVKHSFSLLLSDKGEVDSWKSTPIATGLGITIQHTIGRRPDQKGTIEAVMKVINFLLFRRIPGVTTGVRKRCEDDARVTAAYDFEQLNELLHAFVILWNKRIRRRQPLTKGMFDDGTIQSANAIWGWGDENGCLRAGNVDNARLHLLPWVEASVSEYGFVLQGLRYLVPDVDPTSPDGIVANEWLARARQKRWPIQLAVDISTVSFVWLRHAARGKAPVLTRCPLAPGQDGCAHLSWEEWRLHLKTQKSALAAYKNGELRAAGEEFAAVARRLATEAVPATKAARAEQTKAEQMAGIGENRALEEAERRAGTAGSQPTTTTNILRPMFNKEDWPEDHDESGQQSA